MRAALKGSDNLLVIDRCAIIYNNYYNNHNQKIRGHEFGGSDGYTERVRERRGRVENKCSTHTQNFYQKK